MAWRLSDLVECGELLNTRNYSTHGWLGLRGREEPLVFELTGNCHPDLRGQHIRFEAVPGADGGMVARDQEAAQRALRSLAWRQIGVTGDMTAARQVKVAQGSVEELLMRCKAGEPPPFEWKPCLYLEWYGQNGRVVVELVAPQIEYVKHEESGQPEPSAEPSQEEAPQGRPGLGITVIRQDESGQVECEEYTTPAEGEADEEAGPDDPYGLFPDELQRELDEEAWNTDRVMKGQEEGDRDLYEMGLMDDLIERSPGKPIGTLVQLGGPLPDPDALDDTEAEGALKSLLGQLALFNIALNVCEHFSPRDALRLLVKEILPNQCAYPELKGTGWIQHFMTSEHCPQCEAEAEEEWKASNAQDTQGEPDE